MLTVRRQGQNERLSFARGGCLWVTDKFEHFAKRLRPRLQKSLSICCSSEDRRIGLAATSNDTQGQPRQSAPGQDAAKGVDCFGLGMTYPMG
jgi:hypothetical protein